MIDFFKRVGTGLVILAVVGLLFASLILLASKFPLIVGGTLVACVVLAAAYILGEAIRGDL